MAEIYWVYYLHDAECMRIDMAKQRSENEKDGMRKQAFFKSLRMNVAAVEARTARQYVSQETAENAMNELILVWRQKFNHDYEMMKKEFPSLHFEALPLRRTRFSRDAE